MRHMRKLASLAPAQRFSDLALLLQRVFVGLFLIWSVWDNVTSPEQMEKFGQFLHAHGFAAAKLLAPVSVYLQLAIGVAFVTGLFTRWAGLLCAIHFAIAIFVVDYPGGVRGIFPSGCLLVIGLYLATRGAGRFSVDEALGANDVPRSAGSVRLRRL